MRVVGSLLLFFWFLESKNFNFSKDFSGTHKPIQYVSSPARRFADPWTLDRHVEVETSLATTNVMVMTIGELRRGTREKCLHCESPSELKK